MCGKTPKPPPPIVQRDPVAEQAKADAQAQQAANAQTADKRRRRLQSGNGMAAQAIRAATLGGSDNSRTLLPKAMPDT
jgi:type IV secretory pathway TrbL component